MTSGSLDPLPDFCGFLSYIYFLCNQLLPTTWSSDLDPERVDKASWNLENRLRLYLKWKIDHADQFFQPNMILILKTFIVLKHYHSTDKHLLKDLSTSTMWELLLTNQHEMIQNYKLDYRSVSRRGYSIACRLYLNEAVMMVVSPK